MNFGMIGAIGGVGSALSKEGDRMYEEEKEARADTRQRSLQEWLMAKRQEFQIQDEARAEDRAVRTEERTDARSEKNKDREFERTQREAPTRRGLKAEDEKASARAKSEAAEENLDRDVKVKKATTEAGQTESQKDLQRAQADYYGERDRGSKTDKLGGADSEEAKSLREAIKDKRKMIDQGRIDGTWNDSELTPGQKKMQAELVGMEKRQRALLEGARGGSGGGAAPKADPLGIRSKTSPPAGTTAPGKKYPTEASMRGAANSDMGANPDSIRSELQATKDDLAAGRIPEADRAGAQEYIASLEAQMQRVGTRPGMAGPISVTPTAGAAAKSTAQPGTPAAALEQLVPGAVTPGDAEATRGELGDLERRKPTIKDSPATREAYGQKVQTLRAKLRGQEDELARRDREAKERDFASRSASGTGPAFRVAAP